MTSQGPRESDSKYDAFPEQSQKFGVSFESLPWTLNKTGTRKTYTSTSPPLFLKGHAMGEKWPVPMNLPFFAVEAYVGGGPESGRKKNRKMPSGRYRYQNRLFLQKSFSVTESVISGSRICGPTAFHNSNLYHSPDPISIAAPAWPRSLEARKTLSTPPICTAVRNYAFCKAVRLPFLWLMLWRNC